MEAILESQAQASSAAHLTPRERMQMMKANLMQEEARERSKPWEQSRITRKSSHLGINIPSSYRDRPPPASGILRRISGTGSAAGSDSASPCPSPYSACSDLAPPSLERRSSKVRFSAETTEHTPTSNPAIKRQSSVDLLRADLERAKASLTGALATTMNELSGVEHSLRRLSAEEFDEAFKPQPLRMPRMSRALSLMSNSSHNSENIDFSVPYRPPKSPLRHSISASGASISGPSRSISVSTVSGSESSGSSFSIGPYRDSSTQSTSSSISYDLPSGPGYQALLPVPREPEDSASSSPSLLRTPTVNRGGWSGDSEISPRSTPQPEVPVAVLPEPPVEASPASSRSRSSSIWSLTGLDFPVPPERVWVFPKLPSITSQGPSALGESAIVEDTGSPDHSPAMPVLELVEELERRMSIKSVRSAVDTTPAPLKESNEVGATLKSAEDPSKSPALDTSEDPELSPEESPLVTPIDISPISAARTGDIDVYAVPLSFTKTKPEDILAMTLLEAAVDCDIISPNSSLLKVKRKAPARTVNLDEDDDGWMGSDAEEEDFHNAIRRLSSAPRRKSSPNINGTARFSQVSNASMSSESTMEVLTPLPSSSDLPSHGSLPTRSPSGKCSPGAFAWGKSSPRSSPTLPQGPMSTVARLSKTFQFQRMPKPLLNIEWGPPEVLYDAMNWVWRPQAESPSSSPLLGPSGSNRVPAEEEDDEDLRDITFEDITPRPIAFDRVPSPPLRMPDGVEDWLLDEDMPGLSQAQVGLAI